MTTAPDTAPTKVAILVRKDLGLTPGKMAAQTLHAAARHCEVVHLFEGDHVVHIRPLADKAVALYVEDESQLNDVVARAILLGIPSSIFRDGGKTEVAPDTATVAILGPAAEPHLNRITGSLPLVTQSEATPQPPTISPPLPGGR